MARAQFILDRYRVIEEAGSGGYATVQHAYDTHLKRDVAIKCIPLSQSEVAQAHLVALQAQMEADLEEIAPWDEMPADADPALAPTHLEMPADPFESIPGIEEARSVAHLNDPHIVTVYDCVVQNGVAYVIMEFVEGNTLAHLMDEMGDNITVDMAAAVFAGIAQALKAAHQAKLLHLDIKPENVLINPNGQIKVTDFGLSALMDASGSTTTGGGTIGYMPLEQMRREPLDVRTDEWALASLTYEMLTGSNPFFAPDLASAEAAIEEAELVLPSLCWDTFDQEIDDILFAALDPDPDERFATVDAFAKALQPQLGDPGIGTRELAAKVQGVEAADEEDDEDEVAPAVPLVDQWGRKGAHAVGRVLCAASTALLSVVGLMNIHLVEGSLYGVATDATFVFFGLVLALTAAAAIWPRYAILGGYVCIFAALIANMAWFPALIWAFACGAWWRLVGRRGLVQAAAGCLQPLFGSCGLGALGSVGSGALLPVLQSVITAAFAAVSAMVLASLGSLDLMNWDISYHLLLGTTHPADTFIGVITRPATWIYALSWVAAAAAFSLACVKGTKLFDLLGSVAAAAILLGGVVLAAHFINAGGSWTPSAAALIGALMPGGLGILAALMEIPDRARLAEGEWE